jgi:hypothetical protein
MLERQVMLDITIIGLAVYVLIRYVLYPLRKEAYEAGMQDVISGAHIRGSESWAVTGCPGAIHTFKDFRPYEGAEYLASSRITQMEQEGYYLTGRTVTGSRGFFINDYQIHLKFERG